MAEKKITKASVLALIKKNKITASRGAQLLGMSLWDFLDLMHANGLTLYDDTPEEMEQGLRDLRRVIKKRVKKASKAVDFQVYETVRLAN